MKEFDYIILGAGCAGLSLAFELDINKKLNNKTLAIVETRDEYKRDKTWSFWKVIDHNFEKCVIKSWNNFSINSELGSHEVINKDFPYQTIDSGLFYKTILNQLTQNKNIQFFKNSEQLNLENSFIFNSIPSNNIDRSNIWQHFKGIEIETSGDIFDDEIFNLMDFDCDQRESVHFFYTLPYSKTKALIETTWISDLNNSLISNYDDQLKDYIKNNLRIKNYTINFKEAGAIPLFYPKNIKKLNQIEIGTAGGMTRLSTGYTFLNIQEQSKYIRQNLEKIRDTKLFSIKSKYQFLDKVFLKVLRNNPNKMPKIFYKMFNCSANTVINFLSNKSNIYEDISIISKMPKLIFLKQIF